MNGHIFTSRIQVAFQAIALAALTSCANSVAERNLALQTSAQVSIHQRQIVEFVTAQADLNAAEARELDAFARSISAVGDDNGLLSQAWTTAGKGNLLRYRSVALGDGPEAIIARIDLVKASPQPLDDGGSAAALGNAKTSLAALAATPSAKRRFYDAVEILTTVNTDLSDIQSKAAKDKANATSKTAAAKPAP